MQIGWVIISGMILLNGCSHLKVNAANNTKEISCNEVITVKSLELLKQHYNCHSR